MNTHCKLGKARSGQSTIENLLVLCVVVGIVLIIGTKIKKYIPDLFGPIGNAITSTVATIPESEFQKGYTRNDFRGHDSTSSGATTLRTKAQWQSGGSGGNSKGGSGQLGQTAPTVVLLR